MSQFSDKKINYHSQVKSKRAKIKKNKIKNRFIDFYYCGTKLLC